jgi:hypothetical protein
MSKLDKAIAEFPLISWLSEFTKVKDRGTRNIYVDCPICETKKSLGVWIEKRLFHCFGCDPNEGGKGGGIWNGRANLVQMIALVDKCSKGKAIAKILKLTGFPDVYTPQSAPKVIIPEEAIPLRTCSPRNDAVRYLVETRKLPHLVETSYVCVEGKYRDRIILPVFSFASDERFKPELIGFEAKSYVNAHPKSLFPDWFDTESNLYVSRFWNIQAEWIAVTESIFDAETIRWDAVGCFGGFKDGQWSLLLDMRKRGVHKLVWMLDGDAWLKQTKHILARALPFFHNYVVDFKKDEDPNSVGTERCHQLIEKSRLVADEFDLALLTLDKF